MRGRRRVTLLASVLITLLASSGWLLHLLPEPASEPIGGDLALPYGALRAGTSLAALSAVVDPVNEASEASILALARLARADTLEAVSAIPSLVPERWRDLDALLLRAVESVREADAVGAAVDADLAPRLGRIAEAVQTEATRDPGTVSGAADALAPPSHALAILLAVASVLTGAVGAILLWRSTSPAAIAETSGSVLPAVPTSDRRLGANKDPVSREHADHPAGSPNGGFRGDPKAEPPAHRLPKGVLVTDGLLASLEKETARCSRYGHALSLVVVTVDDSQRIVRAHGENGLTYVLDAVCEMAESNTRASDTVGILSGARIGVMLPETTLAQAERVAGKLRRNVDIFPFADGMEVTVSTGCVDALVDLVGIVP